MRITMRQLKRMILAEVAKAGDVAVEIDYTEEESLSELDVDSFVELANSSGFTARVVDSQGPGGGLPVVRIEGEREKLKRFLKRKYDPYMDDDDFAAFMV